MASDSQPETHNLHSVGKKLAKNSIVGMLTQVIHLVSRLFITPFVLLYIPLSEYGLWTICFVILSYAGMSAFGVNNAYIKYAADYNASGNLDSLNELLSTGLIGMCLFCGLLFLGLWTGIPYVMREYSIAVDYYDLAVYLILGTAAVFLTDLALGCFRSLLEGLQEIALSNWLSLFTELAEVVLIFILLPLGFGVRSLLMAYAFKTAALILLCVIYSFRKVPSLKIGLAYFNLDSLKQILVFGGKIQVLGFLGMFVDTFDRVVAAWGIGLKATGMVEIGRKFPNAGRGFSSAAFIPFMPAASYLGGWWEESPDLSILSKVVKYASLSLLTAIMAGLSLLPFLYLHWRSAGGGYDSIYLAMLVIIPLLAFRPGLPILRSMPGILAGNEYFLGDELKTLYLRGMTVVTLINALVFFYLAAAAGIIIPAWVGDGYSEAVAIMVMVAFANMVHQSTGPGTYLFRGLNRSGREFEYLLVQAVLSLFWIPLMTLTWGIWGAGLGFSLSAIGGSVYFILRTNAAFRIKAREFTRGIIVPSAGPAISALITWGIIGLFPALGRWQSVFLVLGTGIFHVALGLFLSFALFLTPEDKGMFMAKLKRSTT